MHYNIYLLFHYLSVYLHIYLHIQKGIYECEEVSVAVWEEKNKREAGANEQPGLTKFKVESPPRWDLRFFLVYRCF